MFYRQHLTQASQCPGVESYPHLQMWKLRQRTLDCLSKDTGLVSGKRCQLRELVLCSYITLHTQSGTSGTYMAASQSLLFISRHCSLERAHLSGQPAVIRKLQGSAPPCYTASKYRMEAHLMLHWEFHLPPSTLGMQGTREASKNIPAQSTLPGFHANLMPP